MGGRERILVLYNEPVLPEDHHDSYSEIEVYDGAVAVTEVLCTEGYEVRELSVRRDPMILIDTVREFNPHAVFNLFEGTADHYITEAYSAGLLEWLDVPFTGCPCETLLLAQKKQLTKRLLQQAGIPTAPFVVVDSLPNQPPPLRWPFIIKPACQDSSIGIDQGSVVTNPSEFDSRVRHVLATYGKPVLIEEFIAGREMTLGVVEVPHRRTLPLTEVTFQYKQPGVWPILSYDAKWTEASYEYQETDYKFGVTVEPALLARLESAALTAFDLLGARDYARVDFRVRGDEIFLLEMNPNPSFAPERGLTWAFGAANISHRDFTLHMIRNALRRGRRRSRTAVA